MKWKTITAPVGLPMTYNQVYAHSRLPDTSDKDYVLMLMAGVTDFVQSEIAGSLLPQTLEATYYNLPFSRNLTLPRGPVQSIVSITANGIPQASSLYALQCSGFTDYVNFTVAAPPVPIVITYVAGYPLDTNGKSTMPADLRMALLIQFSQSYEFREGQNGKPLSCVDHGLARIYEKYNRTARIA